MAQHAARFCPGVVAAPAAECAVWASTLNLPPSFASPTRTLGRRCFMFNPLIRPRQSLARSAVFGQCHRCVVAVRFGGFNGAGSAFARDALAGGGLSQDLQGGLRPIWQKRAAWRWSNPRVTQIERGKAVSDLSRCAGGRAEVMIASCCEWG